MLATSAGSRPTRHSVNVLHSTRPTFSLQQPSPIIARKHQFTTELPTPLSHYDQLQPQLQCVGAQPRGEDGFTSLQQTNRMDIVLQIRGAFFLPITKKTFTHSISDVMPDATIFSSTDLTRHFLRDQPSGPLFNMKRIESSKMYYLRPNAIITSCYMQVISIQKSHLPPGGTALVRNNNKGILHRSEQLGSPHPIE